MANLIELDPENELVLMIDTKKIRTELKKCVKHYEKAIKLSKKIKIKK